MHTFPKEQRLANLFCKGPESKHFSLGGPYMVMSQPLNSVVIAQKQLWTTYK